MNALDLSENVKSLDLFIRSELDLKKSWTEVSQLFVNFYGRSIQQDLFNLRLAFYESIVNVIKHAHDSDGREFKVEVKLYDNFLEYWVYDSGPGFDWQDDAVCGDVALENSRGLFLINSTMDEMKYIKNKDCNLMLLRKNILRENKNEKMRNITWLKRKIVMFGDEIENTAVYKNLCDSSYNDVNVFYDEARLTEYITHSNDIDVIFIQITSKSDISQKILKNINEICEDNFIPIIVTSASGEVDLIIKSFESGCHAYISSNVSYLELQSKLNSLFNLKDKTRRLERSAEQLTSQLNEAKNLQVGILPPKNMKIGPMTFNYLFKPCSYVGGDMLNYFSIDENTVGFYVADVSGHGVASAMFSLWLNKILTPMLTKNGIIKSKMNSSPYYKINEPSEVCSRLDKLMSNNNEQYLTMFFGLMDHKNNKLTYSSCGHPLPYIIRGENVLSIDGTNPPIGMDLGLEFWTHQVEIEEKDEVFIFSDCLLESKNKCGDQFGEKKLKTFLEKCKFKGDKKNQLLLEVLSAHTETSSFEDDLTILTINYK